MNTVRVIIQFDSEGELESLKFVDGKDSFGFANEVEKTVKNWKLTQIEYRGKKIKMRFYKSFKFQEKG